MTTPEKPASPPAPKERKPLVFEQATTENVYARIAIAGATGNGKTLTALKLARGFGGKTLVVDTERNTARIYSNHPDTPKPFYIFNLTRYEPAAYRQVIAEAIAQDVKVLIIDSITPSWSGKGGVLEIADGDFRGWKNANPEYTKLVEAITGNNDKLHVIVTLRSKMDYSMEINPATGRTEVKKHGLKPIHRDEFLYEFDLVGDMLSDHSITFAGVGKSRFEALTDRTFEKPGAELAELILKTLRGE